MPPCTRLRKNLSKDCTMKMVDIAGKRFSSLLVIGHVVRRSSSGRSKVVWECRCDCGKQTFVEGYNLKNGSTKSCGCRRVEVGKKVSFKHGMCRTPEYRAWAQMMARCYRKTSQDYPGWGGRGIEVCERWRDSKNFIDDMGPRPSPKHSLDRIDNDGNYSKENCRWATRSQQNRNRRQFGLGEVRNAPNQTW